MAHEEIALDPTLLDRYVGQYQFVPGVVLTITRKEARVFAQITRQPPAEIFASSPHEFFYKAANVQLTFEVDGQGRGLSVTLRQNGVDQRATRID